MWRGFEMKMFALEVLKTHVLICELLLFWDSH